MRAMKTEPTSTESDYYSKQGALRKATSGFIRNQGTDYNAEANRFSAETSDREIINLVSSEGFYGAGSLGFISGLHNENWRNSERAKVYN